MKKTAKDPVREDRIHEEAVVDAYGPEEKAMSWYYYLEGKLTFPFEARCIAAKTSSPLRKGEAVEVLRLAKEEACENDMLVQIKWQGPKMAVPLSQLAAVNPDESTAEAIGDWHSGSRKAISSEVCPCLRSFAERTRSWPEAKGEARSRRPAPRNPANPSWRHPFRRHRLLEC